MRGGNVVGWTAHASVNVKHKTLKRRQEEEGTNKIHISITIQTYHYAINTIRYNLSFMYNQTIIMLSFSHKNTNIFLNKILFLNFTWIVSYDEINSITWNIIYI